LEALDSKRRVLIAVETLRFSCFLCQHLVLPRGGVSMFS